MKSIIAKNVKDIMQEKCFKQSLVAQKAGYPYKTYSNMLNGRKIITDVDVMKIANALGVEPNELYGINKQEDPEKEAG